MKIDKNIGKTDKIIRLGTGAVLLLAGLSGYPILLIPATIALVTGITGFCGAYKLLGINTCKR